MIFDLDRGLLECCSSSGLFFYPSTAELQGSGLLDYLAIALATRATLIDWSMEACKE